MLKIILFLLQYTNSRTTKKVRGKQGLHKITRQLNLTLTSKQEQQYLTNSTKYTLRTNTFRQSCIQLHIALTSHPLVTTLISYTLTYKSYVARTSPGCCKIKEIVITRQYSSWDVRHCVSLSSLYRQYSSLFRCRDMGGVEVCCDNFCCV